MIRYSNRTIVELDIASDESDLGSRLVFGGQEAAYFAQYLVGKFSDRGLIESDSIHEFENPLPLERAAFISELNTLHKLAFSATGDEFVHLDVCYHEILGSLVIGREGFRDVVLLQSRG